MNNRERCPGCGQDRPPQGKGGLCPSCQIRKLLGSAAPGTKSSMEQGLGMILPMWPGGSWGLPLPGGTGPMSGAPPIPAPAAPVRRRELEAGRQVMATLVAEPEPRTGVKDVRALNLPVPPVEVQEVAEPDPEDVASEKLIMGPSPDHPEAVERFLERAKALATLSHPGVPKVKEMRTLRNGRPGLVLKVVPGWSLSWLLTDRADASDKQSRLLGIFDQVCNALAYVHARGVTHGTLGSSSVVVGPYGEVLVSDWGLAEVDDRPAREETLATQAEEFEDCGIASPDLIVADLTGLPRTAKGPIPGRSGPAERRDVFGLGTILAEILIGPSPETAKFKKDPETLRARLDACAADPELVKLARACLASNPDDQPSDAGQVVDALSAWHDAGGRRLWGLQKSRSDAEARADNERRKASNERRRVQQERHNLELQGRRVARARWLVAALVGMWVPVFAQLGSGNDGADRAAAREEVGFREVGFAMSLHRSYLYPVIVEASNVD